jgi:hypothetical protein
MNLELLRRRYCNTTTFCWATVVTETGERLDLGDPWPAVRWPKAVLEPEARRALAIWKAAKAVERGGCCGR